MARFSFRRCWAVMWKEVVQFRRDTLSFGILLTVPLIELLLFGYALNVDTRHMPTVVIDQARNEDSRRFIAELATSSYFDIIPVSGHPASGGLEQAEAQMRAGTARFVVVIPPDLSARIARQQEMGILIEADMSDPIAANNAIVALDHLPFLQRGVEAASQTGAYVLHRRYNPEAVTSFNVVPALLGVILEMTLMIATGLALTRESERGTIEGLLSMPILATEMMVGKILPYVVMGMMQLGFILIAARVLFDVPFRGPFLSLWLACSVFILCTVLLGYTISTFVRTQMQATHVIFSYFLPSLVLSGFMFPFEGMPAWAQALGNIFPLTHFIRIIRAVMLKGASLADLPGEAAMLVLYALLFFTAAIWRFHRTLD